MQPSTETTPRSQSAQHVDREQVLDRLQKLRKILPAFAEEATRARRQAARLRVENRKLLDEVRRLQRHDRTAAR